MCEKSTPLTFKELKELPIDDDAVICFLCPDGYEDCLTKSYYVEDIGNSVIFVSYVHRNMDYICEKIQDFNALTKQVEEKYGKNI